jgi:hypothetical protein
MTLGKEIDNLELFPAGEMKRKRPRRRGTLRGLFESAAFGGRNLRSLPR